MADHSSSQPEKLGIYIVQRLLGRGGMGAVYLALDPTLKRPVALKVLAPELAADPEYVARFHREATSLARIRHPNLVHIYAVGQDANRHFIAMEYLKGLSVADILRQRGPLPHPTAVRILGQVLSALDKVHAAGIVHRDLKPANIMIDEDQRAILTDFGLAKPRHDHSVTAADTLIGTPEYMAPELAEGAEADFRSDIYALGVILFELLTARVPYRGNSAIATLRQHAEKPIPSARALIPALPPELDAIIAKAMAKRPDDRYPHVRGLAANLLVVTATHELSELSEGGGDAAPSPSAAGIAASPTTPTVPACPAASATAPLPGQATFSNRQSAIGNGKPARRWLLAAAAAAGLAVAAALLGPPLYRRIVGPRGPRASKTVFVVTARGRAPLTGRLLKIAGEGGSVAVKTAEGVVEIPYRDVLKIEPLVGR